MDEQNSSLTSSSNDRPANKFLKLLRTVNLNKKILIGICLLVIIVGGLITWRLISSSNNGIKKIKHVIIIMQENRSFDNYFGTFPGADGIPMQNGVPTVCSPDPQTGVCVKPYVDHQDENGGGPHGAANATADINGGKMNGFIGQALAGKKSCANPTDPACTNSAQPDVMGYHTESDIPNYWTYAKDFVLNDHMFESNASWSLPEHLYLVSEWSAKCSSPNPESCVNDLQSPGIPPDFSAATKSIIAKCRHNSAICQKTLLAYGITPSIEKQLQTVIADSCDLNKSYLPSTDSYTDLTFMSCENALQNTTNLPNKLKQQLIRIANNFQPPDYAWTDLTYLLHKQNVSWRFYVMNGTQPDCQNDAAETCPPVVQNAKTPGIWNPLPYFETVKQDGQLGNIQSLSNFYTAAKNGTLPSVAWITPAGQVSEHPPALVSAGQSYVTGLINAVMQSPDWDSTAIFLCWDDWGGFYDNVKPPQVDINGYGLRVPAMVISPYSKQGYVDHQILSQDAYIKFIEDDFLGGQRIDPKTDGRPDPRPDVRENEPILGNLVSDFNFNQAPRKPVILNTNPKTTLIPPTK